MNPHSKDIPVTTIPNIPQPPAMAPWVVSHRRNDPTQGGRWKVPGAPHPAALPRTATPGPGAHRWEHEGRPCRSYLGGEAVIFMGVRLMYAYICL